MQPLYGKKQASDAPMGMSTFGVGPDSSIRKNAVVMVMTCLPCYLIVEIPALIFIDDSATTAAKDVNPFAWIGAVICAVLFFAYIAYQYYLANVVPSSSTQGATDGGAAKVLLEQRVNDIMIKAIKAGRMGLRGLLMDSLPGPADANGNQQLADEDLKSKANRIVRPFFSKFDLNGDGTLSRYELGELLHTLGERVTPAELEELFRTADTDSSGEVDFNEFVTWVVQLIQKEPQHKLQRARTADARMPNVVTDGPADPESMSSSLQVALAGGQQETEDDADDDDEPEVPEDILDMHLSPEQQRKKVLQRSCYLMGVGTFIVLLFSDPMVDVLDQIGTRTGIPPFFVAFVLGPIASNASEMVASYKYAQKKSQKTISVAFSQLLGAASMNNTFCLFIFYLLIAARGFGWVYHAEVLGIVFSEIAMAVIASKRVHTVRDSLIVLSLFPLCLVIVAVFKATVFKAVEG
jgi:Ca2+/Na+ antiporter